MDRIIASERIASVIKPDSITVLQGDFLATHVALDKLYLLDKFEPNSSEKSFSGCFAMFFKFAAVESQMAQLSINGKNSFSARKAALCSPVKYPKNKPCRKNSS